MRLLILTAVTLCFAACSGCEEKKTEPAQAAAPAVTPAPAPQQPTQEQLQAAVNRHPMNPALRRLEPRMVTLNGRQVKMLPSRKFLRRGELKLRNPADEAAASQPAATPAVTEEVKQ